MKTIIALFITIAACGDNTKTQSLDEARATIKAECGDAPVAPGYSVSSETINGFDRVCTTVDGWNQLATWYNDVETYTACVQGFAINH